MCKRVIAFVLCLSAVQRIHADIVVQNASGGGSTSINSGDIYRINFQTSTSPINAGWYVTSLKVYGTASSNLGTYEFSLRDASNALIGTATNAAIVFNSSGEADIAFSTFSSQVLADGTSYKIFVNNISGLSGTFTSGSGTLSSNAAPAWTSLSQTGAQATSGIRFELNGSAVPEPGTLVLASLAAASGGCGVWWKRRRKKVLATRESGEAI